MKRHEANTQNEQQKQQFQQHQELTWKAASFLLNDVLGLHFYCFALAVPYAWTPFFQMSTEFTLSAPLNVC